MGEWKRLRDAFPTDQESQYLVRIDKDGFRRYFVCELTESAWNSRLQLRGCSFDHFDFVYDDPASSGEPEQADLIPDPEIPEAFWMELE
jgi:hypothetical protein